MGIAGNMARVLQSAAPAEPVDAVAAAEANPEAFSIAELQAYVNAHPDAAAAILDAEQARGGDARSTLVAWLSSRVT